MNISEKIKEMQDDLGKCHELEKNKDEIIGESSELLDFMFYKRQGPIFSLSIKKEHICGLSIFHKAIDDEESAAENVGMSKALYQ